MKETKNTDKQLKALIEQSGYTQKSFAQSLGKAYSTVQYYVSGEKSPSVHVLDESEYSLPNSLPNPNPNPLPNSHPNSLPNYGYEEIKTIKVRLYRYWRWLENGKLRSKYLGRVASLVK